nr:MAG TPA: CtsR-like protein [Caudoviricetes sp.]
MIIVINDVANHFNCDPLLQRRLLDFLRDRQT